MRDVHCFRVVLLLMLVAGLAGGVRVGRADEGDDFIRAMNLGKAFLENRETAKAIETMEAATRLRPDSPPALRNLGRAYLMADRPADALEVLNKAAALDAASAATHYLRGLALVHQSAFEAAIPKFEDAARFDPASATVRFQLALACQAAGRDAEALTQFRETTRLDPMHAAAWFKRATYARQAGDADEARICQREFMRLRTKFGERAASAQTLESCRHTEPEAAPAMPASRPAPAGRGIPVRFVDATERVFKSGEADWAGAAVLDVDGQGRPRLVAVRRDGAVCTAAIGAEGVFVESPAGARLADKPARVRVVVGDFHDDVPAGVKYDAQVHALNDVLLLHDAGVTLIKQASPGRFEDVTAAAGLDGMKLTDAVWTDAEHDGDLDLLAVAGGRAVLLQNNGNGTFTDVSAAVGLPPLDAVRQVLAIDLDQNDAVDFLAARGRAPTIVIENRRAGQFARMAEPPGPWPAASRLAANDLDNDGLPDAVLAGEGGVEVVYGAGGRRERLAVGPKGSKADATLPALVDVDNDGWLDLMAAPAVGPVAAGQPATGEPGRWMIWRNVEGMAWENVARRLLPAGWDGPVHDLLAGDFDLDGDSDLVVVRADGGMAMLRNEGGHANGQVKLRLLTQKTNPSGYGTHVEARRGSRLISREVTSPVVEVGVGDLKTLDTLQTVWTNGVVDNLVDAVVAAGPVTIIEKNVATGSCPFLYAWDGERFRFVTDILGNAPVGLPLRRDLLLAADADEFVVIGDADSIRPKDGRFLFEVTSEFLEVLYFDAATLYAVDHPADVEIHTNDKLMPPPFPASALRALGGRRRPVSAMGDDGIDRTEAVREMDNVYAPPGENLPPPYRGMCRPLVITLDFGDLPAREDWVLGLTGWIQYGQGSTNIALSQNPDAVVLMPELEVEDEAGRWRPVDVTIGMPAGKTKTIIADLAGKLPARFRRLRLRNTFEIRWDRIALFEPRTISADAIRTASPVVADLRWRGFSEIRPRGPHHPTTPDYDVVSAKPAWRSSMEGWCTRYGDVLELVAARDWRMAFVNGGDAVRLAFDAAEFPQPAAGVSRTYLFHAVGWEKDGDHNVVAGDLVEPGAGFGDGADIEAIDDAAVRFNTRWSPRDQFRD